MNGFERIVLGVIFAFIVGMAWKNHSPKLLYVFAFFSALSGVASSTGYQPAKEAPYAWGMAVALTIAGFLLQHRK